MNCKKCNGTSIVSRTNYPYGRKSRSRTTLTCLKCGSTEMEAPKRFFKRRGKR